MEQRPLLLQPNGPLSFPDPAEADDDGLVAIGGDLSFERLELAYRRGIFPWFNEGFPVLWWSPNPRAVIESDTLHVSKSMRRVLRRGRYAITFNGAFEDVMRSCGEQREGGTWIVPEMRRAYGRLHELGHAHSFEVWDGSELVGGLYGVQFGALFAAESMFHRHTDASKIALIVAVRSLMAAGIELFDVQFVTPHLRRMGAIEIPRSEYLTRVGRATQKSVSTNPLPLMP